MILTFWSIILLNFHGNGTLMTKLGWEKNINDRRIFEIYDEICNTGFP